MPLPAPGDARLPPQDSERGNHIWRRVFYAGTEWAAVPAITEFNWCWEALDKYLGDEARKYLERGWYCYIWGATEPKFIQRKPGAPRRKSALVTASADDDDAPEMVIVPVLNICIIEQPLPSLVGIASVQLTDTELVPMGQMGMRWEPAFISTSGNVVGFDDEEAERASGSWQRLSYAKDHSRVFYLSCDVTSEQSKAMPEEDQKKYEYAQPYVLVPSIAEQNIEDTRMEEETKFALATISVNGEEVELSCPLYGMGVDMFISQTFEEKEWDKNDEKLVQIVREAMRAAIMKAREKGELTRKSIRERLDALSPAARAAAESMVLVKAYPRDENDVMTADLKEDRALIVNRFFGKATKLIDCAV